MEQTEDPFFGGRVNISEDPFFGGRITLDEPTPPDPSRRKFIAATALAGAGLVLVANHDLLSQVDKLFAQESKPISQKDLYESVREPGGTPATTAPTAAPTASAQPSPTEKPTTASTKEPTKETPKEPAPDPAELAKKEVGQMNIMEYLFGGTIERFMEERARREIDDPPFAEAVNIWDDNINIVLAGVDLTRERADEKKHDFNEDGVGRADSIIVVSFNPHTLKAVSVSIPRDLFDPSLIPFTSKARYGNNALNEGARINEITKLPLVDPQTRPFQVLRRTIESYTGLPIDMIMETNIDFWQSYNLPVFGQQQGFFDQIFPDGLPINVPARIVDENYPVGYETMKLIFEVGDHKMDSRKLTEYGRTRHSDSNYGRETRQRQIMLAGLKNLFPRIVGELALGRTGTLKTIQSAFEQQAKLGNLFYNTNIINILGNFIANLEDLRSTPKGLAMLSLLSANTRDQAASYVSNPAEMFASIGLRDITAPIQQGEFGYTPGSALIKFSGSRTNAPATQLGNFLAYPAQLRRKVKEAVQTAAKP